MTATATIKGAIQNALSFQAFRVVGCEFKVTGELTEKIMKDSQLEFQFQYRIGTLDKEGEEQRHLGVEFFLKVQSKFLIQMQWLHLKLRNQLMRSF